jgi:hypothetical protein
LAKVNLFDLYKYHIIIAIVISWCIFFSFVSDPFAESLPNSLSSMINLTDIEKLYIKLYYNGLASQSYKGIMKL